MGIGPKIKEYRNKLGITQKDLADQLHVTYQAVSRWENDDAEPSFDTIRMMCKVFNCTTDDLFGIEKPAVVEEPKPEPVVVERVVVKEETKTVLGICEKCGKVIYDPEDLEKPILYSQVRSGRSLHTESRVALFCKECNDTRLRNEQIAKERAQAEREEAFRKRRIHSIIWPALASVILFIISIACFANAAPDAGILFLVLGFLAFTFIACMILDNNFIADLWLGVSSWGFVRFPGIIFEFSLDGLKFLIIMKILFFILGMILSFLAAVLATAVASVLSLFVYPFALRKNIKNIE